MRKITKALSLILLAAVIVLAAARTEYKNNETCHHEWMKFHSAVDSQQTLVVQADSINK